VQYPIITWVGGETHFGPDLTDNGVGEDPVAPLVLCGFPNLLIIKDFYNIGEWIIHDFWFRLIQVKAGTTTAAHHNFILWVIQKQDHIYLFCHFKCHSQLFFQF